MIRSSHLETHLFWCCTGFPFHIGNSGLGAETSPQQAYLYQDHAYIETVVYCSTAITDMTGVIKMCSRICIEV